jgi:hypothetical protein
MWQKKANIAGDKKEERENETSPESNTASDEQSIEK